ncbi:MAG: aminopeptidase [Burkholderiaceae bacterium]
MGLVGACLLAAVVCATSGCSALAYYAQSVNGHLDLVQRARPVPEWLADTKTSDKLKQRLALSQHIRDFAVRELGLPDNASYRRYADLQRSAALWNVVAAPELSLTLETWCFPVVGCVSYRGYFDRAAADTPAAELRARGLEVNVYAVPAYSTLGKLPFDALADPLLNTFIDYPEGELARLIFHELAHQVAYARDDTAFNESFAAAVERIGSARWFSEPQRNAARDEFQRAEERRHQFRTLTQSFRNRLNVLYESSAPDSEKRSAKAIVMTQLRADYEQLKTQRWGGYSGYDNWFAHANNASFGVLAAYNELVPAFERLFERQGRDFPRFYAEVQRLAALPKQERHAALSAASAD